MIGKDLNRTRVSLIGDSNLNVAFQVSFQKYCMKEQSNFLNFELEVIEALIVSRK